MTFEVVVSEKSEGYFYLIVDKNKNSDVFEDPDLIIPSLKVNYLKDNQKIQRKDLKILYRGIMELNNYKN
jgi:hypothetical protein